MFKKFLRLFLLIGFNLLIFNCNQDDLTLPKPLPPSEIDIPSPIPLEAQPGDVLLINNYSLVKFDSKNGEKKWSKQLSKGCNSFLGYWNNNIFVSNFDGSITSINSSSGNTNWVVNMSYIIVEDSMIHNNKLYLKIRDNANKGICRIECRDAQTSELIWQKSNNTNDSDNSFYRPHHFFATVNNVLLVNLNVESFRTNMYALDLNTGKEIWKKDFNTQSPIVKNGKIYTRNAIINPINGDILETLPDIIPVAIEGNILIATYKEKTVNLVAYNLLSKTIVWKFETKSNFENNIQFIGVNDSKIFFNIEDSIYELFSISIIDGSLIWKQSSSVFLRKNNSTIAGNTIFKSTIGSFEVLSSLDGSLIWKWDGYPKGPYEYNMGFPIGIYYVDLNNSPNYPNKYNYVK